MTVNPRESQSMYSCTVIRISLLKFHCEGLCRKGLLALCPGEDLPQQPASMINIAPKMFIRGYKLSFFMELVSRPKYCLTAVLTNHCKQEKKTGLAVTYLKRYCQLQTLNKEKNFKLCLFGTLVLLGVFWLNWQQNKKSNNKTFLYRHLKFFSLNLFFFFFLIKSPKKFRTCIFFPSSSSLLKNPQELMSVRNLQQLLDVKTM